MANKARASQEDLRNLIDELRLRMGEIESVNHERMTEYVNSGKGYLESSFTGFEKVSIIYKTKDGKS